MSLRGKSAAADPDCPVCKGTGTVRNVGDNFTTTVEAAAAYEQAHGGMPDYRTCKCWYRDEEVYDDFLGFAPTPKENA